MQIALAVITLALISVSFGLCGYLFLTLKRDIHAAESKTKREAAAARAETETLRGSLEELRRELDSMPPLTQAPAGSGINLNKRTQALKMMRLGDQPERIAAALSLPRAEVDLLVKVQKLLVGTTS